jgi:hypothetical protein
MSSTVGAVIPTASQPVPSLEHADAAFAPDTPPLFATEPPLAVFV